MEKYSYKDETEHILLESSIFNLNMKMVSLLENFEWCIHERTNEKYPLRRYDNKREIKYIVLHYTATTSNPKNGLSEQIAKVWNREWNNNPRYEASADFGVDEDTIVQYNPNLEYYHCFATSNNFDKISIEMCTTYNDLNTTQMPHEIKANAEQWGFSEKVLENTKKLIIELYNMNNVDILDEAIEANKPYNINIVKQVIIYFMLGFVLAAGILFIIYYFDRTVKSIEQVEQKIKLPILGGVQEYQRGAKK